MSTVNAQICDFKTKVKSFSLFHKEKVKILMLYFYAKKNKLKNYKNNL